MSVIKAGVGQKEDFLMQVNGDYNVPFDEVEVTGTFAAGTILENATTAVSSSSTEVLGVLAEDVDTSGKVRVMVRGNPSTVNAQELEYGTSTEADIDALLEAKGIVVVDK